MVAVFIKAVYIDTAFLFAFKQFIQKDVVPQLEGGAQLFRAVRCLHDEVLLVQADRDVGAEVLDPAGSRLFD